MSRYEGGRCSERETEKERQTDIVRVRERQTESKREEEKKKTDIVREKGREAGI